MVDKPKIESKLNSMKLCLSRLNELKKLSKEVFLESFTYFDSAKYNLITAIEAMIDICNHIISRENYEIPATSSDSIKILVKHQILPIADQ
ncbi:MAG TPA: HepT-like ribonuclease domain-containing protein, partial [Bacillota bacterium]|nr:HepT-like ribonuclease domain-containing protein [Bacillota bacterium]